MIPWRVTLTGAMPPRHPDIEQLISLSSERTVYSVRSACIDNFERT